MVKFTKIECNEFSRVLPAARLALLPVTVDISADGPERAALAQRFDLMDLASLTAKLTVARAAMPRQILVKGRLEAALTQACVVTLQPVEARLAETFEAAFRAASGGEVPAELAPDFDESPPELLGPEGLDLGELVAQQLAVALDPYPRAGDAQIGAEWVAGPQEEIARQSPFAVLKGMKGNS